LIGIDTSFLAGLTVREHPSHDRCWALFEKEILGGQATMAIAAQVLAEFWRRPSSTRTWRSPAEVGRRSPWREAYRFRGLIGLPARGRTPPRRRGGEPAAMTADIQRTNSLAAILRPGFLVEFCRRWRVRRLELFGSAATGELRPGSDLDFLITFHLGAEWSLLDHVRMKQELETLTGRKVDLMTRRSLEQSHNSLLRESILGSVRVVYSADEALDAAG
jgi:hypothetical protein